MEDTPTDFVSALEDDVSESRILELTPLVSTVLERFDRAKRSRQADEERWLKCYYNYRGLYSKDVQFTSTEKSRVFVKVTKTKVLAAYGQLLDVLFANGRLPLTVEPTELPEGVEAEVHVDLDDMQSKPGDEDDPYVLNIGYPGDGNDLKPGETLADRIGSRLSNLLDKAKVKLGFGTKPTSVNFEPAKIAAKKMERKIHDQLGESRAQIHIRSLLFEMVLLGTGVLKGPFSEDREYPKWDRVTGEYKPIIKSVPRIEHVSIWNFYPDPEAVTINDAAYLIERHKMTRYQLRELKKRPLFRAEAIEQAVDNGPNWTREWWESDLDDSNISEDTERFEVIEYWGTIDTDLCREYDIDLPDDVEDAQDLQVNIWLCGDKLLRLVVNPFNPRRLPYHACPYELNPYNFFGVGLAENMEDSQTLMNGFTRLAVDNAVLSANMMIEVDETNLVPGQSMEVYPGKVWRRQGGAPGQAIFGTKWPNTTQENMLMFDRFRQIADEATGIPSYSHGQTGVQGTGRTAAGMSMLMGAASLNIKTVVKNVDDYVLRSLGEAMFAWNMQFDFDPDIVGDLDIKARGTASLMMREVKSQRLIQFMQATSNPVLAPHVKFPVLLRELAESMDIDPDKICNDADEAKLAAQLLAMTGGGGSAGMGGSGAPGNDQIGGGGGNIGVGAPPMPGSPQFSGQPQMPPQGAPMSGPQGMPMGAMNG